MHFYNCLVCLQYARLLSGPTGILVLHVNCFQIQHVVFGAFQKISGSVMVVKISHMYDIDGWIVWTSYASPLHIMLI